MNLTDREREILNCLVGAWDDAQCPMPVDVSYAEAFALLERLGLDKPSKTLAWIETVGHRGRRSCEQPC